MLYPSREQAEALATQYDMIPVSAALPSDMISPMAVLKALKSTSGHCFLLESVEDAKVWGRYTFLGYDPILEITCHNGTLTIKGESGGQTASGHPSDSIRTLMQTRKAPRLEGMPPFTGGLVGYFSYDYIKYSEPSLQLDAKDEEEFNDMDLMLFDKVIVFDNLKQTLHLIVNVEAKTIAAGYDKAADELMRMQQLIQAKPADVSFEGRLTSEFRTLFDKQTYCSMVEQAKRHIYEGDIFQVVLSNRLEADFEGSLFDTYRALRRSNPSPYLFYFSSDKMEMAGASPETLVKLQDGVLHTFPLAGTSKRGQTEAEDLTLERALLSDEKELAEHNMLVDLGRNDLGKISQFGSVRVEDYQAVLRFSHVMHIGSTVSGQIREGLDAIDAIEAVLPAGTLSGAPKIKACEIINRLENNKRGVYGGAVGYLDFTGNLDMCIAIRLCFQKNGKIFVRSGAGIVADSVAEKEFEECIQKAKAVVKALESADGGFANDFTH